MKRIKNNLWIVCILWIAIGLSSCSKDEENDCGFAAVVEANKNYRVARQAYSNAWASGGASAITPEICNALKKARLDFETKAKKVTPDCLKSDADKKNLLAWLIGIAATPSC